jgi:hypothetical protein
MGNRDLQDDEGNIVLQKMAIHFLIATVSIFHYANLYALSSYILCTCRMTSIIRSIFGTYFEVR